MDWWKKFGIRNSKFEICLIIFAAWFVYSPAFHGAWLGDWDDAYEITRNSVLRDPAGLRKIWLAPSALDYYPLKTSVQWVQWRLWGLDPFGYHLTNVALHLLSAFLLWHLLRKLGVRLAWLGGLLFVVHPMMIESVAWIVELKNTLSMAFLLLAMIFWIRWSELSPTRSFGSAEKMTPTILPNEARSGQHAPPFYFLSLIFFVAAMLSKTTVVMFPFALLLYAWWRRGRVGRRDLLASAPFFAVSLVLGLVTIWFQQHRVIQGAILPVGGFFSRLAVEGLAAAFYFWKFLVPVNLMPVYPRWNVDPPSALQFLPWVAIGGVFLALWRWSGLPPTRSFGSDEEKTRTAFPMERIGDNPPHLQSPNADQASRGRAAPPFISGFRFQVSNSAFAKDAVFGLGWFLLFLLPVSGFVPIATMRFTWVMDHFAYVSLLGLIGLVAAAISKFEIRNSKFGSIVIAALLAALAVHARRYAGIYRDQKSLWSYAVARNPGAWVARTELANILVDEGRLPEAKIQVEETLRLQPNYAPAENNLGNILIKTGHPEEAIAHYERALRLNPGYFEVHINLADALFNERRYAEAIVQYQEGLRLQPDYVRGQDNLKLALRMQASNPSP